MSASARILASLLIMFCAAVVSAAEPPDVALFEFTDASKPADWSPVKLAEAKGDQPAPRIEITRDAPNLDKASVAAPMLKITFAGGQWPTIGTSIIPVKGTWKEFQTLKANLTVEQTAVAFIGIGQGAQDAKAMKPQWQKTLILRPGRNEVSLSIRHGLGRMVIDPKEGEITSFIIGMFQPAEGEKLWVDNVRLGREWPEPHVTGWYSLNNHDGYSAWAAKEYERTGKLTAFKIPGSDTTVASYEELSKKLKPDWKPPVEKTLDRVEAEFKAKFDELKKTHPNAILAILRDGEKGVDPLNPEAIYAGWKSIYLSCHGPDGPNAGRETPGKQGETLEAFMRHRSVLMQADLSTIPKGATILAAELVITRVVGKDFKPISKANLWVTEPCNRDWDPTAANCYYYAKDKLWKAVSGLYYGQDPDFYPVLLSQGPGSMPVGAWDFTAGLKFWIEQGHDNHGFFFYGDSGDYMLIYTQKAKNVRQRPAILVVYSPKEAK